MPSGLLLSYWCAHADCGRGERRSCQVRRCRRIGDPHGRDARRAANARRRQGAGAPGRPPRRPRRPPGEHLARSDLSIFGQSVVAPGGAVLLQSAGDHFRVHRWHHHHPEAWRGRLSRDPYRQGAEPRAQADDAGRGRGDIRPGPDLPPVAQQPRRRSRFHRPHAAPPPCHLSQKGRRRRRPQSAGSEREEPRPDVRDGAPGDAPQAASLARSGVAAGGAASTEHSRRNLQGAADPMSDSRTEAAIKALVAALAARAELPDAAIPAPLRNEALPARMFDAGAGIETYLNVWDGSGEITVEFLGADLGQGDGYQLAQRPRIEWVVAGGTAADREAKFDAGLQDIRAAIAPVNSGGSLRFLAGALDRSKIENIARAGSGLVTDGLPNIKS